MAPDAVVPSPVTTSVGEDLDGRGQEVELAADGGPARRGGAGEQLGEREHRHADEDAREGEPCAQEALAVDDGSPFFADGAGDGEPAILLLPSLNPSIYTHEWLYFALFLT